MELYAFSPHSPTGRVWSSAVTQTGFFGRCVFAPEVLYDRTHDKPKLLLLPVQYCQGLQVHLVIWQNGR